MAISFNEIPGNLRVPFVAAEFNSSQASQGPGLMSYRALLIGQKTVDGTAAANSLHRVTSPADVITLAGRGSMLHRMAIAWFASNRVTETWIGVLEDDDGGAEAEGTITVSDANLSIPNAAESGTIALYLGGVRVAVGVTEGDTAEEIATAIAAAINEEEDLPVTAAVVGAVVTVTHRHKGEVGNAYDIRHSFRDREGLPEGVALAIVEPTGGSGNPDLDDLIAALGDVWYHVWAHPYTDATSLGAIETELASRFGPMRMIDGVAIASAAGSLGTLAALGNGRNSQHSVIVAQAGENPLTPPEEFAAETAAIVAIHGNIDPARPFQTLAYRHAIAPAEADLFTLEERNQLLFDGIASSRDSGGGVVQVDRLITTYQTNGAGAEDDAYLDLTTLLNLMYQRFSFRARMQTRYPRHKLADDGTRFGSGQAVITPKLGKAEALAWFRQMEELGLVEGFEQFKRDLVVERNGSDPNRLDFLLPPDLINQLVVSAASIQFRL